MKRLHIRLLSLIVMLGCVMPGMAQDDKPTNGTGEQAAKKIEQLLDKKFAKGKYSKKGADTCMKCHDSESTSSAVAIFNTPHGQLDNSASPMSKFQCETCHGPAGKHSKSRLRGTETRQAMITFGKESPLTVDKQNSVCLSCHSDHQRFAWQSSTHEQQDVACASCHTLHKDRDPMMVRELQAQACGSCHITEGSAAHKFSSHPFDSGDVVCSDCHQPHGSLNDKLLQQPTVNDTCSSCHQEKSGPKLWEHAPVIENCANCHNPHGSNYGRMLKLPVPQLCQSCHGRESHASAAYTAGGLDTKFAAGDSCLNCHNQIHGSNHPAGSSFQR